MYLTDVRQINKIKDEKRRKRNARLAIQKIENTRASYAGFFQWPALFESFSKDIEHLRTLE